MATVVMKFGGTSVANIERIQNVARHVKREVDAGNKVAVVVSAMAGVTNQLVGWVKEASHLYDMREYDAVVGTGEQVTAGLLAIVLQSMGYKARSWISTPMSTVSTQLIRASSQKPGACRKSPTKKCWRWRRSDRRYCRRARLNWRWSTRSRRASCRASLRPKP